jgi:heat shock protein HslJ
MKSNAKLQDVWLNSHRPSPKPDVYNAQFGKERNDEAWQEMQLVIEGFTYTAGQIYHLRLEELTGEDSQKTYRLAEIVSTETDPIQMITDIYVLSEIPGEVSPEKLRDVRCTVELNAASRTIMGTAPCNQFSGEIKTLTTTEVSFGPLMATKMACPQLAIERMVFDRLGKVTGYHRKGLLMHLTGTEGESLLILRKVD